ncbi:MAG: hypothetical protein R2860_04780 [Desulfobacterales bacterium]
MPKPTGLIILLLDEGTGLLREKVSMPDPGELPLVKRLRTAVRNGVDYHPYLPGRTVACP